MRIYVVAMCIAFVGGITVRDAGLFDVRMTECLRGAVLGLLLVVASASAVPAARAQTTGAVQSGNLNLKGPTIHDCTGKCLLAACAKDWPCTLWRCGRAVGGCVDLVQLHDPSKRGGAGAARGSSASSPKPIQPIHGAGAVYAKVCLTLDTCDVYALRGSHKTLVGKFGNIKGAVLRYAARHASH